MTGLERSTDCFDHGIKLLQDVGIPEAEDGEPLALEEASASPICFAPFMMLTSVNFDHKPALHTTEIGDEGGNRVLSSELRPSALSGA